MSKQVQINQIKNILKNGWVPHEFWGYTTVVMERTMSVNGSSDQTAPGEFNMLRNELIEMFAMAGIDAHVDNKIAFGFKRADGSDGVLYVGFYDWHCDVGKSVRPDSWLKPKRAKAADVVVVPLEDIDESCPGDCEPMCQWCNDRADEAADSRLWW